MSSHDTTKGNCNLCSGDRNHFVLSKLEMPWEDQEVYGAKTYEILKCCGCDSITLQQQEWFSETLDQNGGPAIQTTYYPPATFRREPDWLYRVDEPKSDEERIFNLLGEVYVALQNDLTALAAMGIRSVVERVMVSQIGDQGTFGKNIQGFEAKGFISKLQRERLETIIEAGHAVVHRAYSPSYKDLVTLVDIVESLVQSLYVHGDRVADLKERIPARMPRPKS